MPEWKSRGPEGITLPVTFSLTMDVGCDQFSNFSTRLFVNRLDCRCSSPREQKNIFL